MWAGTVKRAALKRLSIVQGETSQSEVNPVRACFIAHNKGEK